MQETDCWSLLSACGNKAAQTVYINYFHQTGSDNNTSTLRTDVEMKTASTFANWDIVLRQNFNPDKPNTWFIDESLDYLRLWWEYVVKTPPELIFNGNSVVQLLMQMM